MRTVAVTDRLILRELDVSDAEQFYHLNADPEVIRYTGDSAFTHVSSSRKFLEQYDAYALTGMGRWAIIRKADGAFLGWCGLKMENGRCDLGYRLHRQFWGNGYAFEAAMESLRLGFGEFGLEKIIGRVMEMNLGSIRVLEKCGFVYSGHFRMDGERALLFVLKKMDFLEKRL